MKFIKLAPAVISLAFTVNANAGFFSSSDDFKCGQENAIKAFEQSIRDGASEMLQSDALENAHALLNKPVGIYTEKMKTIGVNIKGVSTESHTSHTSVSCRAKVSIALPKEAIDVLHAMPERIAGIQHDGESFYDNNIVWKDYSYSLKLSDDKKDISVKDEMDDVASSELYMITLLSVNKKEIIEENNNGKVQVAQNEYHVADTELNTVWKNMPDSVRASMKSAQLTWVKAKVAKCGKISDALSESTDATTRVNIFSCQTKMTNDRIAFLGGSN